MEKKIISGLILCTLSYNALSFSPTYHLDKKTELELLDIWQYRDNKPWISVQDKDFYVLHNTPITEGQTSSFFLDIHGQHTIEFDLKTKLSDSDYIAFYINGLEKLRIHGSQNYSSYQFKLPKGNKVRLEWVYSKDSPKTLGDEGVWLDNLKISGSLDQDQDALNDLWEYKYFKHLNFLAEDDIDDDGLNNLLEQLHSTSPLLPDSDGDSYLDGFEVEHNFNPVNPHDRQVISSSIQKEQEILFKNTVSLFEASPKYHKIALRKFKYLADQGSIKAAYMYAYMHEFGLGTLPDLQKAFDLYYEIASSSASARFKVCSLILNDQVQKYTQADGYEHCRIAAEMNHPQAQLFLAMSYHHARYFEKDLNKAWFWYQKAANQNDARAQFAVGLYYLKGFLGQKNILKAAEWFSKAAQQKFPDAQLELGNLLFNGYADVKKDQRKAFDLYEQAALKNNPSALFNQYLMYAHGWGVPKHNTLALEKLKASAAMGHLRSIYHLGNAYFNGSIVRQNTRKAIKYFLNAAEQGFPLAQYAMGQLYYEGKYVPRDISEALKWLKKVAVQGEPDAQNMLGWIYYDGLQTTGDHKEAYNWFKQAAQQFHPAALYGLYRMYTNGSYVSPDRNLAQKYLIQSADYGHAEAQLEYGLFLYDSSSDLKVAYQYILKAARQDYPRAQHNLAFILYEGVALKADLNAAAYWAHRSVENGYHDHRLSDYLKRMGYQ